MQTKKFTITSDVGLHARPATVLVQTASQYTSDMELEANDKKVNVKSIMGIMSLGLKQGDTFQITISGDDEMDAFSGIENILTKEGIAKS